MTLRIGYKASAEQFDPTRLAAFAVRAEEVGLDSVTISDHFQPWRLNGGHAPNSLAWLGWVAARTERVLLGTSVMTPTFRYNPPVVAQTFATLACLAPGRVMLGVGTGEALNEVAVGSVAEGEWPEFKERFGRLREAVRLMRMLWTEESVTFEGDYYRTKDARIFDRPDTPVPVYVAAGGQMVARYAGRVGDGFICTSGKGRELYADKLRPRGGRGRGQGRPRRRADRPDDRDEDPGTRTRSGAGEHPLLGAAVADRRAEALDPLTREMEQAADALPDRAGRQAVDRRGRPEEVVEAVRFYTDLGFDHLVVHGPGEDQERFLDTFAEQVVPALRELEPADIG